MTQDMKIVVHSKEEDIAVQLLLFADGAIWNGERTAELYFPGYGPTYPRYLFVDKGKITNSIHSSTFGTPGNKEYKLENNTLVPVVPPVVVAEPPIGLIPRITVARERLTDVLLAIGRYNRAELKIPTAWTDELFDLLQEIADTMASP